MKSRFVKVVAVSYFELFQHDLAVGYEANTFEQAVDNQRRWYEDDPSLPMQEYVDGEVDMTFELMPEGFNPEHREELRGDQDREDPQPRPQERKGVGEEPHRHGEGAEHRSSDAQG